MGKLGKWVNAALIQNTSYKKGNWVNGKRFKYFKYIFHINILFWVNWVNAALMPSTSYKKGNWVNGKRFKYFKYIFHINNRFLPWKIYLE